MILVTGATGNVGGHLVQQLCGQGAPVRALVRTQEKGDSLRGYDCEVVVGSYDDPESLAHALHDVDRVFLLSAPSERMAQQEIALLDVLAGRRLTPGIVKLGVLGVDRPPAAPARLVDQHRTVVERLHEQGLPATVLAPNSFFQNFLLSAGSVQEQGAVYAAAGEAATSFVDARDVAAVAAHVLTSDGHEGATYSITGPQALTYAQVAEALSSALDRPVHYVDVPPDGARAAMVSAGLSGWLADGLLEMFEFYRDGSGAAVTDEVQKATGRPARSLPDFLHDHLAAFR